MFSRKYKVEALIKLLTFIPILIPLLLFIKFSLTTYEGNFLPIIKKTLNNQIMLLSEALQKKIQQLKFYTPNRRYIADCQQILKLCPEQSQKAIALNSEQFKRLCAENHHDSIPQMLIITYLGEKSVLQQSKPEISLFVEQINKDGTINIIYQFAQLQPNMLPHHLNNKLFKQAYKQQVAQHLLSTMHMKHCLFTYKKCKNIVLMLFAQNKGDNKQWQVLTEGFYEYQNVHFINADKIQQHFLYMLDIDLFLEMQNPIYQWQKWLKLRSTHDIKRNLVYLTKQVKQNNFLTSQSSIQKYLKQVGEYLNNTSQREPESIMYDDKYGKVDIFASQYRLGILLPIIVSFILFPFVNILKK